jgi:hypothetical protein
VYWRLRAPTVARPIERNNALSVESKSILCHFLLFETLFVTSAPSAVSPLQRFNASTLQRFNSSYVFTGWSIIAGELTVDETGNAFTGSGGTVEVYDPNGVLVTTLCADSVGTRFEL